MIRLTDLSIRKKFAVAIIPLLLIIVIFDFLQIRHNYFDYRDSRRLNKAIVVGIEINHLVHELQKERGITAGYLSNQGELFASDLDIQRKTTDSTLRVFREEVNSGTLGELLELHGNEINRLNSEISKLTSFRKQVDQLEVNSDQTIEFYSYLNDLALSTVNNLINESRDKDAAEQVHAIIYFLKAKESASIERAIGTQAFANGFLTNSQHAQISSLVSSQKSYIDAFLTIAQKDSREYFENKLVGEDVEEVKRLEQILLLNDTLNTDPNFWYRVITTKINILKEIEDYMSEDIHEYTETISKQANFRFWSFIIVDIVVGALTLLMIGYIVTNLLKNVETLRKFTILVSKGNFRKKVNIKTKDEIGQYAKTFNAMVAQIHRYNLALRKQRNKAQYLYEKVYKQYEVVFDNVEQGIFLLDKNFRISKLYSKAMERIFDNKKIANEEFSNFMRSRLIPRDLEALEMFMKHLFNPDIDEDVLGQLNPVESVKIFVESQNGVDTKYIRFHFTRIMRNDEIRNIMVTVLDETESVLLQQHLEEADAQKKLEMEQLLDILKIDPSVLRGFIHNSQKVLKGISDRYEKEKNSDLKDLLSYTFKTIHSLKGNAMVIGLDLISDKFHEAEENINELKGNSNITGKDFLTILYEINDADDIITRMGDMLKKVAGVYSSFGANRPVDPNFGLIDTLKRGLDKMSEEQGKAAELTFKNDKNIAIPLELENQTRDILVQLVRNSIAHGIELPNERVAKKKLIKGSVKITLEENENDDLRLIYEDDGTGINAEKVISKAINNEIITEEVAKSLSKEEIAKLIFEEGFSTAEKVDNFSGRGQGMSVIKSQIDEVNGSFEVDYKKDEYFRMIINLPVSKTENVS